MSDAPGKLNLDEAMGRKPSGGAEIQPTLRIRRSDLKVLRRKPEPKKKRTMAFGVGAFAVAVILGVVLWFSRGAWLPFWQSVMPASGNQEMASGLEGEVDVEEETLDVDGAGAEDAAMEPEALPFEGASLPPPETLAYFCIFFSILR